jgi:hypothetical protein
MPNFQGPQEILSRGIESPCVIVFTQNIMAGIAGLQ